MKKVLLLLSLASLSVLISSCGSKSDPNRAALNGNGEVMNSNLESIQIRQKYGIKQNADIAAHLRSVEIDLNDSGLYFSDEGTPYSDNAVYEGKNIRQGRINGKIKRATRRGKYGKAPKGIVWKKQQNFCEDLVITLDYAPEGSYEPANLSLVLREYYDIAELYLNVTEKNEQNCEEYNRIQQAQQQISRQFMRSANAPGGTTTVSSTQAATAGGTGGRIRIPYGTN